RQGGARLARHPFTPSHGPISGPHVDGCRSGPGDGQDRRRTRVGPRRDPTLENLMHGSRVEDPARGTMAKAAVATRGVDLEPIDRLEEKVKLLVGVVDRLRAESAQEKEENARLRAEGAQEKQENVRLRAESTQAKEESARLRTEGARAAEENTRLRAELDNMRGRLTDGEGTGAELTALRDERAHIRGRVADMLQQIEALNL